MLEIGFATSQDREAGSNQGHASLEPPVRHSRAEPVAPADRHDTCVRVKCFGSQNPGKETEDADRAGQ
jgi:hypothetical protein